MDKLKDILSNVTHVQATYIICVYQNGVFTDIDDARVYPESAYGAFVESLKYWPPEDVCVIKVLNSKPPIPLNVTHHFVKCYTELCENRGIDNVFNNTGEGWL